MNTKLFDVVFSGKIKDGASVEGVQERLGVIFKMPQERVRKIFTGHPVTLKTNLEFLLAQKYLKAFEGAGAICEIVPAQAESEQSALPPVKEAVNIVAKPITKPQFSVKPQTFKPNLSGFWRRILAFVVDILLLGILGAVLGYFLFDQFAKMGQFGRLIGFTFSILYFGLLNSSIGGGQTLGKRLMKITVVSAVDGTLVSWPKSAWRYVVLSLPFLCNGLVLPLDNKIITLLLTLVVFGMGGALLYLYIFNRNTRQSIHDLAAKTLVVQCMPSGRLYNPGVWKGHMVLLTLWTVVCAGGVLVGMPLVSKAGTFPEMSALQQNLMQNPDIQVASVTSGKKYTDGGETNWASVTITVSDSEKMNEEIANLVAVETFSKFPSSKQKDLLTVNIKYGYDIGISTQWRNTSYSHPPKEWEKIVSGNNSRNPNIIVEKHGNITNYRVEGSLAKTHDLPCISIDQAKNTYTPADLYASAAKCVVEGRERDGAQIYFLAGVYAVYDAARVADKTAGGARQILVINNFSALEAKKKESFSLAAEKIKDAGTEESKAFCRRVKELGKPDYHPQYMILHGMSNFLNETKDDGLLADYDPDKNWEEALAALKWCDNKVVDQQSK